MNSLLAFVWTCTYWEQKRLFFPCCWTPHRSSTSSCRMQLLRVGFQTALVWWAQGCPLSSKPESSEQCSVSLFNSKKSGIESSRIILPFLGIAFQFYIDSSTEDLAQLLWLLFSFTHLPSLHVSWPFFPLILTYSDTDSPLWIFMWFLKKETRKYMGL